MELAAAALTTHVGLAAVWDLAQRRIPNPLIVSGLLFGFAFQAQTSALAGLGSAFLGSVVALLILIGPFAARWMGGGDVKIAMVCGAFTGWNGAVQIILAGTVAHGLLGIGVVLGRAGLQSMGRVVGPPRPLPHAVGFAVGTVLYIVGLLDFI